MKIAFWSLFTIDKVCFEYQRIKFQCKKWVKIFTFADGQDQLGWPPPLTVSLTIKFPFFWKLSLASSTMRFFCYPVRTNFIAIFLRIIDHRMRLFQMDANHRSSYAYAMFAMYSLSLTGKKTSFLSAKTYQNASKRATQGLARTLDYWRSWKLMAIFHQYVLVERLWVTRNRDRVKNCWSYYLVSIYQLDCVNQFTKVNTDVG